MVRKAGAINPWRTTMLRIAQILSIMFLVTNNASAEESHETDGGRIVVEDDGVDTAAPVEHALESYSFCLAQVTLDLNASYDAFEIASNNEALRIQKFYDLYQARCEGTEHSLPDPNLTAAECHEALESVMAALAAHERTKYEYNRLIVESGPMGLTRAEHVGAPVFASQQLPREVPLSEVTFGSPAATPAPTSEPWPQTSHPEIITFGDEGMTLFRRYLFSYPEGVDIKLTEEEAAASNAPLVAACAAGAEGWSTLFDHLKANYRILDTLSSRGPLAIRFSLPPRLSPDTAAILIIAQETFENEGGSKVTSRGRSIAYFMKDSRAPAGSAERRVSCGALLETLTDAEIAVFVLSSMAGVVALQLGPYDPMGSAEDNASHEHMVELLGGRELIRYPVGD
ncbi:hypothetical protein HYW18_03525 [Candidatus Uhrbacteria bacterium]|nr:hypothetical protein [Candidatus Uhrbacteria bacterium]